MAVIRQELVGMQGAPIVVKANGLAAGKGVVVAFTVQEAFDAVDSMLLDKAFGAAGAGCAARFRVLWPKP